MRRLFTLLQSYYTRYREGISYLFFGVLTTLVNYGVFFVFHLLWPDRFVLLSNLIAFVSAASFAYVTNKLYVFQSRDWSWTVVRREAGAFLAARVFSFGLEEAGLALAAYVLRLGRFSLWGVDGILISKFALSVLATVLNYFFSKYLIFTKKEAAPMKQSKTAKPAQAGKAAGAAEPGRSAILAGAGTFLREHRAALLVLLALFLVRLAALYVLRYDYTLWSDDASYINSGKTFAHTGAVTMHENLLDDGTPVYSAQIMPGMTVLIGLVSMVFGEGWGLWKALKLLWILFGTASAWYVYRAVRLHAPKWCGVAAMLWLFRPGFVWMDNVILTETPFLLCLSAMVYHTLRMEREPCWRNLWGTLVWWLLGLSLKANIALYPLFAAAYLFLRGYDRKLLGKQCVAVACAAACFLVPWTVRNYVHFHAFIPLTYGAGNPSLQGTYQGTGYPPDEDFDYASSVDAVIRERYAAFYQEDGTVRPGYERYISLRADALKAQVRQRAWWNSDRTSMLYSYLIEKPRKMIFTPFYWKPLYEIKMTTALDFLRLDFALCALAAAASLVLKKRRLTVLFLAGTYLGNIYIYAMTYAFERYNASLMCLRFVLTGIGLSLGLQLLERGIQEIHRFEYGTAHPEAGEGRSSLPYGTTGRQGKEQGREQEKERKKEQEKGQETGQAPEKARKQEAAPKVRDRAGRKKAKKR